MKELKFLGRGSAFNIKEGNTSAYLKENETLLLIDCGETVFKEILDRNLLDGVKDVHILITHLHSDHVGSLSSLLMYCWYVKKIKCNVCYPDRGVLENFLLAQGNRLGETYTWHRYEYVGGGDIEKLGICHIGYMEVPHDKITKVKEVKIDNEIIYKKTETLFTSYGYIIEFYDDTAIWYSGDTNDISERYIEELINSVDESEYKYYEDMIIYQDTCLADYEGNIHLSLNKLCEKVEPKYRNKIYCMHLDCDELIDKAKEEGFNVVEVEVIKTRGGK